MKSKKLEHIELDNSVLIALDRIPGELLPDDMRDSTQVQWILEFSSVSRSRRSHYQTIGEHFDNSDQAEFFNYVKKHIEFYLGALFFLGRLKNVSSYAIESIYGALISQNVETTLKLNNRNIFRFHAKFPFIRIAPALDKNVLLKTLQEALDKHKGNYDAAHHVWLLWQGEVEILIRQLDDVIREIDRYRGKDPRNVIGFSIHVFKRNINYKSAPFFRLCKCYRIVSKERALENSLVKVY